eukprot:scaffold196586_cov44-Attheya_sp.AAC.1
MICETFKQIPEFIQIGTGVRYTVDMNVSAMRIFVNSIRSVKPLAPTSRQVARGEEINMLTCTKSHKI